MLGHALPTPIDRVTIGPRDAGTPGCRAPARVRCGGMTGKSDGASAAERFKYRVEQPRSPPGPSGQPRHAIASSRRRAEATATPSATPRRMADILAEITAGLVAEQRPAPAAGALSRSDRATWRARRPAPCGCFRETGDQLQLVSGLGLPADVCSREQAVDRHCGHCGAGCRRAALVWAERPQHLLEPQLPSSYFGQGCQRLLAVPLQHRGRVLGVYNLFFASADEPGAECWLSCARSANCWAWR